MKREILINGGRRETRVAILEDDRLVELLYDRPDQRRSLGDIYLGRVDAVLPGIQAAFVDIGLEKSAFLHASDLLEPEEDEDPDERDDDADVPDEDALEASNGNAAIERLRKDKPYLFATNSRETHSAPKKTAGAKERPGMSPTMAPVAFSRAL